MTCKKNMIEQCSPKVLFILVGLWGLFFSPISVLAQSERMTGSEIVTQSRKLLYNIDDQRNKVTLSLIERDGVTKTIVATRLWKNYRQRNGIDSKMLLITEFPADSRGVSFLIWDYAEQGKADDLWLHLPALRMVRRISGQDINDAFLGSDLTFGDMGQRRLDEDEHRLLDEEVFNGVDSYRIESTPKEEESIYSKKLTWISKVDWTVLRNDYFDRSGRLLKRQTIKWQTVGDFFVWEKTQVINVQNGHRTVFEVSDLKINQNLRDQDFTERSLRRGLRE